METTRLVLLCMSIGCALASTTTTGSLLHTSATTNGPAPSPLRVDSFDPDRYTPGNVGVAFSGGGSIALSNVMGYLRGLRQLGVLDQVKAISTVSGGTWATAPYTYLPDTITDDEFLGTYVQDQSTLSLTGLTTSDPALQLDTMSPTCLGFVPTQANFGFLHLAAEAAIKYAQGVPYYRLWNHLIGEYVLAPFGLSSFSADNCPTHSFCGNASHCAEAQAANPNIQLHQRRAGRPFHIMNAAMFVRPNNEQASDSFDFLAPVQGTPFMTGIMSSPDATFTDNGAPSAVGGGGVSNHAFDSQVSSVGPNGEQVSVQQTCTFGLNDMTGASSAAFAELFNNQLDNIPNVAPQFSYWPVSSPTNGAGTMTRFSDGGTLENTGVASLLAYDDIDNVITFSYATSPISVDSSGTIVLDGAYPPLFGLQLYKKGQGYVPYPSPANDGSSLPNNLNSEFRYDQVFETAAFQDLLQGLYAATTNNGADPVGTGPAVYLMKNVKVLPNQWFGVKGGKTVNVLFVYGNPCSEWYSQLADTVQLFVDTMPKFPQLDFLETYRPARVVNLLGHLAAWVVTTKGSLFTQMFAAPSTLEAETDGTVGQPDSRGDSKYVGAVVASAVGLCVVAAIAAALVVYRRSRAPRAENEQALLAFDGSDSAAYDQEV